MPDSSQTPIDVLFPQEGEAWAAVARRLHETKGEVLLVLSGKEEELVASPDTRKSFLNECKKIQQRLRFATKHPLIAGEARGQGIRVLDRTKHVKLLLKDHPKLNDALRVFSPHLWRQQLTSRMQRMGILSVPKIRIFSLVGLSAVLFCFVLFRLLPSADIAIKPRQESVSQTVNIFLVQSGATADLSNRVRTMELVPIVIDMEHAVTFDHISKEFIGTSSTAEFTVINNSTELYSLRTGTRFTNQAGMVFRITEPAIVDPGEEVTVRAKADDLDLYGQIIGARGNVPAGLRWDIPGLAAEERIKVYAENRKAATGGTTAHRTVLREADLDLAKKRFEQELLTIAKETAAEHVAERNAESAKKHFEILVSPRSYGELTQTTYSGIVLPTQFLGTEVTSVPIHGRILHKVFSYDAQEIYDLLRIELESHVRADKRILGDQIGLDNLVVHVIDYEDDLSWIKLTVDLTGTEEYVLDPLSAPGALFAKKVRERVLGLKRDEAMSIIRNMPEVENASITIWPPWSRTIPHIPAHISILPE